MTKRQLKKWLENKRERTLFESRELNVTAHQQLADETFAKLGLREVTEQIYPLLVEALKLWYNWKDQQLDNHDLGFYSNYCGFERYLSNGLDNADTLYQRITAYDIRLQSATAISLQPEQQEKERNISKTYWDVISVVDSMSTAKEAEAYLASLGFDLTEQSEAPESSTGMAQKVNPAYLFVTKAA